MAEKLCSVCKKKPIKFAVMKTGAPEKIWYGFCSKVCIANNAIRHYKIKKVI
jgi:hypothetical protein